jgi:hypothetical protein
VVITTEAAAAAAATGGGGGGGGGGGDAADSVSISIPPFTYQHYIIITQSCQKTKEKLRSSKQRNEGNRYLVK